MLHHCCGQFLEYCQLADFSARSIQAFEQQAQRINNFFKNTKNPFCQKGSLPSSDRFYGGPQRSRHSCHKVPGLGSRAILPFFITSQERT